MNTDQGIMWTEADIIKGCKRGKRKAQEALYDAYAPSMRAVCRRYLGNRPESEDILHDALIKALGRIKDFKGKGSFEGWLKRICMTTALDYLKKSKRLLMDSETASLEMHEIKEEAENEKHGFIAELEEHDIGKDDILAAMETLPEGYRAILNMYVVDDLKHKDIAKRLGISENTSKSQLSRARSLLRKNLRKQMKKENYVR
jgi:RNA polymerase sigma-70 factor (ECF subfamily)